MAEEITNVNVPVEVAEPTNAVQNEATEAVDTNTNDEVERLKGELARYKAAVDKATKEASESKKALRARQTAEEIAAEEKRMADEARDNELADLRKRFAVAEIGKKVMALGGDVDASGRIAELLYGAEDVDGALSEIGKLFTAREKALRLEFGRIPAPGVGGTDASPEAQAINLAREIGKARADSQKAQEAMKAYLR